MENNHIENKVRNFLRSELSTYWAFIVAIVMAVIFIISPTSRIQSDIKVIKENHMHTIESIQTDIQRLYASDEKQDEAIMDIKLILERITVILER